MGTLHIEKSILDFAKASGTFLEADEGDIKTK